MEQSTKNKLTIVIISLAFLSPVLLPYWFLNHTDTVEDRGTTNYGRLIQPPRQLENYALVDPLSPSNEYQLYGKWNLVYITDICADICIDNLYRMRQLHIGTDKYSLRVQRVLLMTQESVEDLTAKLTHYKGQKIMMSDNMSELVSQFVAAGIEQPLLQNRLYIIDPMGNLMISYTPDAPPKDILKDIKKLLKASRIG